MLGVPLSLVISFCIFYLLGHYQSIYIDKFQFKGAGPKVYVTVSIYRIFSLLFGLCFLIFVGFKSVWYAPLALLAVAVALGFLLDVVFRFDKYDTYLCAVSFVATPIAAIFIIYRSLLF